MNNFKRLLENSRDSLLSRIVGTLNLSGQARRRAIDIIGNHVGEIEPHDEGEVFNIVDGNLSDSELKKLAKELRV